MRLHREIRKRAHSTEEQGDGVEMVLIRMDEIERAVRAWDKERKYRSSTKRWAKKARPSRKRDT